MSKHTPPSISIHGPGAKFPKPWVWPKNTPGVTTTVRRDGWEIEAWWLLRAGRLEPVEVSVRSCDDGGKRLETAVTAEAVRRLPLGEILSESRKAVAASLTTDKDWAKIDRHLSLPDGWLNGVATTGRPQRGQALTDDDLTAVIEVYRAARLRGEPVNEAVRRHFVLSKDGAAKRIVKARQMLRARGEEL